MQMQMVIQCSQTPRQIYSNVMCFCANPVHEGFAPWPPGAPTGPCLGRLSHLGHCQRGSLMSSPC